MAAPPSPPPPCAAVDALLVSAIAAGAFPCAVAEAGSASAVAWRCSHGTLTGERDGPAATPRTVFDLASLTKVLATATIAMRLADRHVVALSEPIADRLPAWRGLERGHVTLRQLLDHSSGLTAYLPLYENHAGRAAFTDAICRMPLEYVPGSRSLYSDLGFMLLAVVLEDAAGCPLDRQFEAVAALVAPHRLAFRPPAAWREEIAPAGIDRWRGRLLVGEVHDANAWALGGVAGHAGLFGDAPAIGAFARLVLRGLREGDDALARPATLRAGATRTGVAGSSRALGWDTMRPTASCGSRMDGSAIGHSGFTGTSLWIDPSRDLYAVLLTNRVHPGPGRDDILEVRRRFHDLVVAAWDAAPPLHPRHR